MSNTCKSCRFYKSDPLQRGSGSCRVNPPTAFVLADSRGQPLVMGAFPMTQETNWCGKWEALEILELTAA
jgi:hypothetical protein